MAQPGQAGQDGATAPTAPAAPPAFPPTGRADVHMHTALGDGLHSPAQMLDFVAHETDLDVVAVTEHDDVQGALVTRELAARRGDRVQVIIGTEVTTKGGHVLALFVEHDFRMMQSLDQTLAAIHEAGGVAIAPHPLSWLTTAVSAAAMRRILALGDVGRESGVYFDAVELLNPSIAGRVAYERVLDLNRSAWHLPITASSDAHAKQLIGTAYTTFSGSTAADFRTALAAGTTRAHGRFWTLKETADIAGVSTYRAWFVLPVRRLQKAGILRGGTPRTLAPVVHPAPVPAPQCEGIAVGGER